MLRSSALGGAVLQRHLQQCLVHLRNVDALSTRSAMTLVVHVDVGHTISLLQLLAFPHPRNLLHQARIGLCSMFDSAMLKFAV